MRTTCARCGFDQEEGATRCVCGHLLALEPNAPPSPALAIGVWYYQDQGRTQGPVSLDVLRARIASRQLQPTDEVWRQGTPDWVRVEKVADLRDVLPEVGPRDDARADRRRSGEAMDGPDREEMSRLDSSISDDVSLLLPLVRRSTRGTVILDREALRLISARPASLSEEVVLGKGIDPAGRVRSYTLKSNASGVAIDHMRVSRAANLGVSRRRLRFSVRTNRGADDFVLPIKQSGHFLTALRELLGSRLIEDKTFRLTWTERTMIGLFLLGAILLGSGCFAGDWASFAPLAPAMIATGGALLFLTSLAALAMLLVDLGTRSQARKVATSSSRPRRSRDPYRSRTVGWLLKLGGLSYLAILLCSGMVDYIPRQIQTLAVPLLVIPGLFLLFTGYRLSQRVFSPGKHPDPRPPVVYLRSFADDDSTNLQPDSMLAEIHGLNRATRRRSVFGRLSRYVWKLHPVRILRLFFNIGADTSEEVLARGFRRVGPFVAIGRPGEGLPSVGADRMYVGDHEWQAVVLDYLDRCKAVVLQPSKTGNILWEINQSFRRVSPHRILLCMINFWNRPEDYDDFRLRLARDHGLSMPRLVPFRDRPCFVYFEKEGTPRIQDLCYGSPLFWTFTGTAVNTRRTMKSFLAGLEGCPRPAPLPARRHFGHALLSLGVYAVFLYAILFPGSFITYGANVALIVPNLSISSTTYTGRAIDYRMTLDNAWRQSKTPDTQGCEHLFTLAGTAGVFTVNAAHNRNDPFVKALRALPRGADGLPLRMLSDEHPEFIQEIRRSLGEGFEKGGVKVSSRDSDSMPRWLAQLALLSSNNKGREPEMFITFDKETAHLVNGRLWHEFRFVCHMPGVGQQIFRHRVFADLDEVIVATAIVPDMDFYNGCATKALDSVDIVTTLRDRLTKALSAAPTKTVRGKKVPYRLRLPDIWTEKEIKIPPGIVLVPGTALEDAMFDLEGKLAMVGTLSADEDLDLTEPGIDQSLAEGRRELMRSILDQIAGKAGAPLARIEPLGTKYLTVTGRSWLEIKHHITIGSYSYIDLYRVCEAGNGLVGFEANLYVVDEIVERLVEAAFRSLELPPDKPKSPEKTVAYRGKRLGYEFRLGNLWTQEVIPPEQHASEYLLSYRDGLGKFAVDVLDAELGDDETTARTIRNLVEAAVRKSIPSAQVKLLRTKAVTINGVRWLDLKLDQDYGPGARETKRVFVYQSLGQSVWISVVLPPHPYYDRLAEKVLATARIIETPGERLSREAGEGKPIVYRGKAMKYTLALPPLWKAIEQDEETIREVKKAAERSGTPLVLPEHTFSLGKDKLAELGVEVHDEEPDLADLEEIAKNQVKTQRELFRAIFPKGDLAVRLIASRKVRSGGREWGEIETRIELLPNRQGFNMISRFTPYKGRTLSLAINITKDHPAVRKLAAEALDSVRILPAAQPAGWEKSWTGQTVLVIRSNIRFGRPGEKGKTVHLGTLDSLSYRVLADKDGRLLVRDNGQEGWFDKDDAVLLDKAVEYFTARIRQNPKDTAAYFGRAEAWSLMGKHDSAIEDYTEAIRVNPKDAAAFNNRGLSWQAKKRYDKAIEDYTEAIRLDSGNTGAFTNRGDSWQAKGEYDKAIKDYTEALRLDPASASCCFNRGLAWHRKQEYDKAIKDYGEAIRLYPSYALAFDNRARVWIAKGDYDKAIKDFGEAIRLNPGDDETFFSRGNAWKFKKDYAKAFEDYDKSLRLDPKSTDTLNAKAWLLAVCPQVKFRDGKKAVELATQACELNKWKRPSYLATLAAACAESGDYANAIKWQEKALQDETFAAINGKQARERLQLYTEKKPFRED